MTTAPWRSNPYFQRRTHCRQGHRLWGRNVLRKRQTGGRIARPLSAMLPCPVECLSAPAGARHAPDTAAPAALGGPDG